MPFGIPSEDFHGGFGLPEVRNIEQEQKIKNNAHTYKARVHAQVTIFQEMEVCTNAYNEEDFKERAEEIFKQRLEDVYGWVDMCTVNVEKPEDMGELPF